MISGGDEGPALSASLCHVEGSTLCRLPSWTLPETCQAVGANGRAGRLLCVVGTNDNVRVAVIAAGCVGVEIVAVVE